jgi:hypothetical protein
MTQFGKAMVGTSIASPTRNVHDVCNDQTCPQPHAKADQGRDKTVSNLKGSEEQVSQRFTKDDRKSQVGPR